MWSPSSWQTKPAQQQVRYTDKVRLQGVLDEMARLPPLVTSWEVENLRAELAKAAAVVETPAGEEVDDVGFDERMIY